MAKKYTTKVTGKDIDVKITSSPIKVKIESSPIKTKLSTTKFVSKVTTKPIVVKTDTTVYKTALTQSLINVKLSRVGRQGLTGSIGLTGPAGLDGTDGIDGQNGIIGKDGLDGKDGTNGTNGTDGQDGINGADGTNGTNGIDGAKGDDGIDGTDGTIGRDGIDGTNGSNGINGTNGTDGTDGVDGTDGTDGTNGAAGKDGTDGTDGVAGVDGTSGTNGIDGTNGTNGTDGTDGVNGVDGSDGSDGIDGDKGDPGSMGLRGETGSGVSNVFNDTSNSGSTLGVDFTVDSNSEVTGVVDAGSFIIKDTQLPSDIARDSEVTARLATKQNTITTTNADDIRTALNVEDGADVTPSWVTEDDPSYVDETFTDANYVPIGSETITPEFLGVPTDLELVDTTIRLIRGATAFGNGINIPDLPPISITFINTEPQDIIETREVLVPQAGEPDLLFRALSDQTGVTTSTDFTDTTIWQPVGGSGSGSGIEILTTDPTGTELTEGLVWYNSTDDVVRYYNGTTTETLSIGASSFSGSYNDLTNKPSLVENVPNQNDDTSTDYVLRITDIEGTDTLSWVPNPSEILNIFSQEPQTVTDSGTAEVIIGQATDLIGNNSVNITFEDDDNGRYHITTSNEAGFRNVISVETSRNQLESNPVITSVSGSSTDNLIRIRISHPDLTVSQQEVRGLIVNEIISGEALGHSSTTGSNLSGNWRISASAKVGSDDTFVISNPDPVFGIQTPTVVELIDGAPNDPWTFANEAGTTTSTSLRTVAGQSFVQTELTQFNGLVYLRTGSTYITTTESPSPEQDTENWAQITGVLGITDDQSAAIITNTAKVGITTEQAEAIALNTAKVGITTDQAAEIVANNAKVSNITTWIDYVGGIPGDSTFLANGDEIIPYNTEDYFRLITSADVDSFYDTRTGNVLTELLVTRGG